MPATEQQMKTVQQAVLDHAIKLPPDEWESLRQYAENTRPMDPDLPPFQSGLSVAEVVEAGTSEACLPLSAAIGWVPEAGRMQVATIEGSPLYYMQGRGYYCWGVPPTNDRVVDVTLTFPAYPPGW